MYSVADRAKVRKRVSGGDHVVETPAPAPAASVVENPNGKRK